MIREGKSARGQECETVSSDSRSLALAISRTLGFLCCLVASAANAQPQRLVPLRLGESLLNLPTTQVLSPRTWEVRFTHRFSQPINEGDVHSLWGLDSSADVGIGLSYSPAENWLVSLYRTDVQDTVEAAIKYRAVSQERFPVAVALRGGVDWRTDPDVVRPRSMFAQAILSRQFGRKAEIFVVPTYARDASVFESAFNLPVGFAWMIYPHLSLVAEVIPENKDLPESVDSSYAWSVGLKRAIGGHFFEILLSNSRATHVHQYVPGFFLGTGLRTSDVHLGFNIERRFGTRLR